MLVRLVSPSLPRGLPTSNIQHPTSLFSSAGLARPDRIAGFRFSGSRALGFALIVQLLAARQGQLALDAPLFQVNLRRYQGQALFPRLALQLLDFTAVQQQLAPPRRLVVGAIAMGVLADVSVEQPRFIVVDRAVGFLELHLAGFGGLHFGSRQNHAGLEALQQEIIVPRLPRSEERRV